MSTAGGGQLQTALPDDLPIEKVSENVLTPALKSFCFFHSLSAESVKLMSYSRLRVGVGTESVRDSFLPQRQGARSR